MIWDLMWGEAVEIAAFQGKAKGGDTNRAPPRMVIDSAELLRDISS